MRSPYSANDVPGQSLKDYLTTGGCRTNRCFQKFFGRIVDYFGVLLYDTDKALQFDEESIQRVISNLSGTARQIAPGDARCTQPF
ncbi:MAG: hypothetical protein R2824_31200 [Saprospiraceae bacterium]